MLNTMAAGEKHKNEDLGERKGGRLQKNGGKGFKKHLHGLRKNFAGGFSDPSPATNLLHRERKNYFKRTGQNE